MNYLDRLSGKPCEYRLKEKVAGIELTLCNDLERKLPFCDKKGGGIIMHKNKFYKLCLQNIK
jgi:hypothetical protein